ncbi:MAG: hypothetical protein A2W35_03525 [Chloroflexi bacterium RBG_16_57_11]|nr:MAG: hypothetical protein A2W35_03525 [Chloroflexi bacterium RBG_16_57_11]
MTSINLKGRYTPIAILGVVGFVTSFCAHIVAVNLPTYAEQVGVGLAMIGLLIAAYDLGYNPWQSGVLLSLVTASYLLVQPAAGWLADSYRPALTIQIGLGLAGATFLLIPFASGAALALLAILAGLGWGQYGQIRMH